MKPSSPIVILSSEIGFVFMMANKVWNIWQNDLEVLKSDLPHVHNVLISIWTPSTKYTKRAELHYEISKIKNEWKSTTDQWGSGKDSTIISCHDIIVTNNHYGPIRLHEFDYIGIFQVKWTLKRNTKNVHNWRR